MQAEMSRTSAKSVNLCQPVQSAQTVVISILCYWLCLSSFGGYALFVHLQVPKQNTFYGSTTTLLFEAKYVVLLYAV